MKAPDNSYRLLAARHLGKQVRRLARELRGVHDPTDLEHVHQARVASRRLRVALRMFGDCFPAGKVKKWRQSLGHLLKALGPARDCDVQTEFVRGFLETVEDPRHRPGIARLLLRLQQQRQTLQDGVVKAADRCKDKRVVDRVLRATKALASQAREQAAGLRGHHACHLAMRRIVRRVEEIRAFEDCLADPDARERHHAMRIAVKRLRYTMETCVAAYSRDLQESVRAVKRLQALLGNLHDCDVWIEQLQAFLDQERRRTLEYFGNVGPMAELEPGIQHLADDRRRQRRELFADLVDYWRELGETDFWNRLTQTAEARALLPGGTEGLGDAGPRDSATEGVGP